MKCLQLVHKTINVTLIHAEFRNRKWDTLCTALWQHNLFLLSFLLDRLCMSHWLLSSHKCRCRDKNLKAYQPDLFSKIMNDDTGMAFSFTSYRFVLFNRFDFP